MPKTRKLLIERKKVDGEQDGGEGNRKREKQKNNLRFRLLEANILDSFFCNN